MGNSMNRTGIRARKKQAGMTAIGIAMILMMIGFFVFIGLKLFPVYLESFKVNTALKSLATEPGLAKTPASNIITMLMKRLDIDDVESVTKNEVSIDKSSSGITVSVGYEVVKHLFSNISILVTFEKQVEIPK